MIKKSLLMMMACVNYRRVIIAAMFATFIATAAFAQRVGDTGQFTGSSDTWRVQSVSGNTMTLEKVVA
jgi:hypothetical protein